MYTKKVMDHFAKPRNIGEMPDADGIGEVGNPACGDMMTVYIKVEDDRITDLKYKTFGCVAAIAVSSIVSEMTKGLTLEEAKKISKKAAAEELGGLPKEKMHCSNLGADALLKAIEDYEAKRDGLKSRDSGPESREVEAAGEVQEPEDKENVCPECRGENPAQASFCMHCGHSLKA
ncbi:MAG: iron-sulfur cluster assembly scaffold protein [Desulfurivibrionaceae bacterium]